MSKQMKGFMMPKSKHSKKWDFWKRGVSPSFVSMWQRCRGTAWLKYVKGWRSDRTSVPLQFGSACHYVLEKALEKKKPPKPKKIKKLVLDYQYSEDRKDTFQRPEYQLAMGSAAIIMKHYFKVWHDFEFKWLELEGWYDIPYKYPDGKETRLIGVKDGLYEYNGNLVVFDTKCKGRFNASDIFDGFPMNFQFNMYAYVTYKQTGRIPNLIICNIIRIPQIKQGKQNLRLFLDRLDEDVRNRSDFYFARPKYPLTKDDLKHWANTQLHPIMAEIREWVEKGYQPRYFNETGLQVGHRKCDYYHAKCNQDFTGLTRKGK